MNQESLNSLNPGWEDLFNMVCHQVDASMLEVIARADYGSSVEEHLAALNAIKAGKEPSPLEWEPKEVLELTRWSEPEYAITKSECRGARGHWMRLFSCAILIRAAAPLEDEDYFLGEEDTIIQLVDSALALGPDASRAALRFLCWRLRYRSPDEYDWKRPYYAVAVLLLLSYLETSNAKIIKYLLTASKSDEMEPFQFFDNCSCAYKWVDMTSRLLIESATSPSELRRFGQALLGRDGQGSVSS